MFTDNHATILLDYTVKAMVVKFSNKKFNFILSCLENLREMKMLQMKRNEIDVFFTTHMQCTTTVPLPERCCHFSSMLNNVRRAALLVGRRLFCGQARNWK